MTKWGRLLMAPGSSKVWHGCSWEFHIPTLCCTMTSMWNTSPNTQLSSVTIMQFHGNRRMRPVRKCTSRPRWRNILKSCGTSCKTATHVYMCGLKGMEQGMEECFSEIASKNDLVWKDFAKQMKKDKRYHVEVY